MYNYLVQFTEFLILIFFIFFFGFCVTLYMQRWYKIVFPNWSDKIKTQKSKIKKWIVLPWKVIFFDYTTRLGYFYFSYIYFVLIFIFFFIIIFLTFAGYYEWVFFLSRYFLVYFVISLFAKVIFVKHFSENSEDNFKVAYPLDQVSLIIKWFAIIFLIPLLIFINFFWPGSFTECVFVFFKPVFTLALKKLYYLFMKDLDEIYNDQILPKPLYEQQTELSVFKELFPNFNSIKDIMKNDAYLQDVRWGDFFYILKDPMDNHILVPIFSFFGIAKKFMGINLILTDLTFTTAVFYYIIFFILYDCFFTFVFLLVFFLDRDKKHLTLFERPKHFFKKKIVFETYIYYIAFLTFLFLIFIFFYYIFDVVSFYWCIIYIIMKYFF